MNQPLDYAVRRQASTIYGFTPGPWRVSPSIDSPVLTILAVDGAKEQPVAGVSGASLTRADPSANARLIAAAPMLYAELAALVAALKSSGIPPSIGALEALAMVEGAK